MNQNFLKKIFIVVFVAIFVTALSACDFNDFINLNQNDDKTDEPSELTDDEKIIEALSKLGITYSENDSENSVTSDVVFKLLDDEGFTITWSSANAEVIDNQGKVNRPEVDTDVKVTVTVEYNGSKLSKSFTLTVKAKEGETPDPSKDPAEKTIPEILALTVEDGAVTTEQYIVTGKIVSIENTTYGNVTINDEEGNALIVYGLYDENETRYDALTDAPVVGDTITVVGPVKNYKGTIELYNAVIKKVVKGEEEQPPVEIIEATVSEIKALEVEAGATLDAFYRVSGKIIVVENEATGNLYITDGVKNLYIYGLYDSEGKKYSEMTSKPDAGDVVTLCGKVSNYQGTIEIKDAVLESFEEGEAGDIAEAKIADLQAEEAGSYVKTSGTVVALYARGYLVSDETGSILVYMNTTQFSFVVGDVVIIEGALAEYHGTKQFTNSAKVTKNGTKELATVEPVVISAENIEATLTSAKLGTYFKATGKLVVDGSYYNVEFEGSEKKVSITYPLDSLGLSLVVGKQVSVEGYVLYPNTAGTMLQVMVVKVECEEEMTGAELPVSYDFTVKATSSTELPEGWTWGKVNSKGAYASLYQSFRNNEESIVSPLFNANGKFTVSFNYYMNNIGSSGSSKIKFTIYNSEGVEVSSYTSDELNAGATGADNCHEIKADFEATGIFYVKIEFVKNKGGNVAFNKVEIVAKQEETN